MLHISKELVLMRGVTRLGGGEGQIKDSVGTFLWIPERLMVHEKMLNL